MSKTSEKTENRLEIVFMAKDQKECVFKEFVHKIRFKTLLIIQNAFNHSKLAHKQPNGQTEQKSKNAN